MIEKVKYEVSLLLENDDSGHDMCHINRVLDLALRFSDNLEVDKEFVSLIALLHDVDDYKLVGIENSEKLTNAKLIMDKVNIEENIQNKVLEQIKSIGYSKRLKGIVPNCLECMVVSDADMCDALGVNGVLRTYKYSIKNNKPFFDRNYFPIDNLDRNTYVNKTSEHSVCHMFEKILRLKDLMLTNEGRKEALKRHRIVVDILYNLFEEENAFDWIKYLNRFLENGK